MWRWQWLGELAKEHDWKIGAELGVKEGRTSEYLSAMGVAMLAVDLWKPLPGTPYADWDHEKYLWDFRKSVKGRDVTILRLSTDDASKIVDNESLDFVFIDADHSYEGVQSDIEHWTSKVKKGGAIMGHDYGEKNIKENEFAGVKQAVDEAFLDVETGPDSCWLAWK